MTSLNFWYTVYRYIGYRLGSCRRVAKHSAANDTHTVPRNARLLLRLSKYFIMRCVYELYIMALVKHLWIFSIFLISILK